MKNISCAQLSISRWQTRPGECWVVLGRNGSGKRQLGQLIQGELTAQSGQLDIPYERIALLSFEAQQALYEQELKNDDTDFMDHFDPGTTVRELLHLPADLPAEFAFLGMTELLDRGYRQLSSGESRKALLLQALLQNPELLVLDEPYDSLDVQSRQDLDRYLANLQASGRIQLLFLLNSSGDISPWHSHVAIMEKGEIIASGTREQVLNDPDIQSLLAFDPNALPPWPETLNTEALPDILVQLRDGKVAYGGSPVFAHVSLVIAPGQHTLVTGRNGSGKSTLLALITGDHPQCYGNDLKVMNFQRGSGESIWQIKKRIGLVSPELHRNHRVPGSALHIVLSGFFDSIGLYEDVNETQIRHARQWLALVNLDLKATLPFKQLSYGEQRLVLIARALVKQPALLILDEPTQGLDDVNRHRIMYFLEHLSTQQRTTILMVSHRLDERLPLFRKHLDMDGSKGSE
ncbi:MAG: ATP-binding cassette domain-containing protein [Pseudomonadales bacterium]|nr:ATP-binding cassette domain-containing protein [Pseudomonadales bacterium]